MTRTSHILATGAMALMIGTTTASAEQLGCRAVGFINDRDTITVGKDAGRFKSIQLRVSGNDIEMRDLKVVYGNGQVDDVQVRSRIAAGGETRWIDLKGNKRFIDRIVMTYASRPSFKGQARVCVHAR